MSRQSEAPRHSEKLRIALALCVGFVLSAGCRSGKGALQGNSAKSSEGPASTALKVRPLTDRTFERTPERLARGKYLVNGIGECFACHGPYEANAPGWPPVRGKEGSGLDNVSAETPGVVAANLTPDRETGIGNWTDDMLARAIREGVGHDGRLLHPTIMPYEEPDEFSVGRPSDPPCFGRQPTVITSDATKSNLVPSSRVAEE
jgi:mono/diheme cytochrome c family protein